MKTAHFHVKTDMRTVRIYMKSDRVLGVRNNTKEKTPNDRLFVSEVKNQFWVFFDRFSRKGHFFTKKGTSKKSATKKATRCQGAPTLKSGPRKPHVAHFLSAYVWQGIQGVFIYPSLLLWTLNPKKKVPLVPLLMLKRCVYWKNHRFKDRHLCHFPHTKVPPSKKSATFVWR